MFEILLIILVVIMSWFWLDSIAKREIAITVGRDLASRWNLQLLDESVACNKIRLGRDQLGQLKFIRTYDFEVSADGQSRLGCHLELLGKHLLSWHIPPYLQPMH